MATLLLTTVGRLVAGPVGGALGALAGQAIDGRLFRGAAREGPRLTELAVQTSSYGTPIPKLFGTIRVAGTVIWSTDLIETRGTSRSGKGQPGTNTYSYSASFAVALSARPILAVRRIWAEGKLLRGAAGDWKSQTGFRLHSGGDDQPVDPLIASAMGVTPAYRGLAYAVFEGMQLADYGNRIPSLTFEVEADSGPVASGAIAAALANDVRGDGGLPIPGFAASGESLRGVLDTLVMLDGGWWQADGAGVRRGSDVGDPLVVGDCGMSAGAPMQRRRRTMAALASVAREVAVAHHDPARDYQIGVQRARRPGAGVSVARVELPAVLDAGAAKGIAAAILARDDIERVRRQVALGIEGIGIAPGTIVEVADEPGRWRVARSSVEGLVTTLQLVPIAAAPVSLGATSGSVVAAADRAIGRTRLAVAELPSLDGTLLNRPRLSVIAAGEGAGWRQAALLYSLDDGASWIGAGGTAAPGVIGRIDTVPDAASALLVDRRSRILVTLARPDMALGDADAARLAGGGNLALVGDELVQFERAEPGGTGRWMLSGLRRGMFGTEAAIGTQIVGDRFALLEADHVASIDLPVTAVGQTVRVLASGVGDTLVPVEAKIVLGGASVAPPAPVHATVVALADGGVAVGWTRRSRSGWAWRDTGDVPLGEEAEAYRVRITAANGRARAYDVAVPRLLLPAADRPAGAFDVDIVQRGTWAASPPTRLRMETGSDR